MHIYTKTTAQRKINNKKQKTKNIFCTFCNAFVYMEREIRIVANEEGLFPTSTYISSFSHIFSSLAQTQRHNNRKHIIRNNGYVCIIFRDRCLCFHVCVFRQSQDLTVATNISQTFNENHQRHFFVSSNKKKKHAKQIAAA